MEYRLTKPTKNSLNGLLSTNYIITNWENIEMSGSKKYLENMTEITVKEVHMYFYSSKMLGFQFFYQHLLQYPRQVYLQVPALLKRYMPLSCVHHCRDVYGPHHTK